MKEEKIKLEPKPSKAMQRETKRVLKIIKELLKSPK